MILVYIFSLNIDGRVFSVSVKALCQGIVTAEGSSTVDDLRYDKSSDLNREKGDGAIAFRLNVALV